MTQESRPPESAAGAEAKPAGSAQPERAYEALRGIGSPSAIQEALNRREDEVEPSRIREFYVPVIAIPVGFVVQAVLWYLLLDSPPQTLLAVFVCLLLQALVYVPLLVASLVAVARLAELDLGVLSAVLLKTAAVTFGAAAVADAIFASVMMSLPFDWWYLVFCFAIYMVLCGATLAVVFEITLHAVAGLILLIYVPRVMVFYASALAFKDLYP